MNLISKLKENLNASKNKVIVLDQNKLWTWDNLIKRSLEYANFYIANCTNTDVIPILVNRSGESIAAIIGCLLAGKGFSPISPNQPNDRIISILNQLKVNWIIKLDENALFKDENIELKAVLNDSEVVLELKDVMSFDPLKTVYILFTSGSTGVPKGVVLTLANIENTIKWSQDYLDWKDVDVIGCATQFSFDISMFDFFSMIYHNVPLAIFSNISNFALTSEELVTFKVTSIFSVPLFFNNLLPSLKSNGCKIELRRIISGGDFFYPKQILHWKESFNDIKIYNVWGPTETSIVNTMHLISEEDIPNLKKGEFAPIGKSSSLMPIKLYSTTTNEEIVKTHEIGEIVLLGSCVSAGYLNNRDFPFTKIDDQNAFYTSDLGYFDENKNLFMVGRKGSVVKLSGYRVDLKEIESAAHLFPNIDLACVIVRNNVLNLPELVIACMLEDKTKILDTYAFKTFLRSKLPNYMVPKFVQVFDKLPLNANHKIDRNETLKLLK